MSPERSRLGGDTQAADNSSNTLILKGAARQAADISKILDRVSQLYDAGLTVVPVKTDGSKAPAINWKNYQDRRPTLEQTMAWFSGDHLPGVGILTGTNAGRIEMSEIEGRAAHQLGIIKGYAEAVGMLPLFRKATTGWLEQTPSGGFHWFYRVDGNVPKNTKLSKRPATPEELAENPQDKIKVLTETRGTGGFVVMAPTGGTAHETGRAWALLLGGPESMATLSLDELADWHRMLSILDAMPAPAPARQGPDNGVFTGKGGGPAGTFNSVRPGDDFEAKTSWAELLEPAGWTRVYQEGNTIYWRRPGKSSGQASATTGRAQDRDRLYVFSTSTDFPTHEPITMFHAFAIMHHGGDDSAAAGALRKKDYGSPRPANWEGQSSGVQDGAGKRPSDNELPLDDSPLAQWTADRLRGRGCWAGGLGWMTYTSGAWKTATEATVVEMVRQEFRILHAQEIRDGAGYDRAKKLAALLTAGKIRAVTGLVKGILEADGAKFDTHPDLLNVANGVIDLRTGELLDHSPDYLFTKTTPTRYTPGAEHPDWTQALQALPPEEQTWLQVRFGQAATGHPVPDDIMPVLNGTGENGKSSIVAGIHAALGDHAIYVPERVLLANPSDHPTELTELQGARLALIEETPEARHLNVKRLKDTVGTPTMTARRIRQDSITWRATHSLFLTSNYRPRVDETDHGTWRRLALVRFPYTFLKPGAELTEPHHRHGDQGLRDRIPNSPETMQAVLAWIVDGTMAWYAEDKVMPAMPARVVEDTEAWRAESDVVWSYMRDHIDAGSAILSTDLLKGFNQWLRGQNHREWSANTFTARLESQQAMLGNGVEKRRVSNPSNLSRLYPADPETRIGKETVWQGIRFSR